MNEIIFYLSTFLLLLIVFKDKIYKQTVTARPTKRGRSGRL